MQKPFYFAATASLTILIVSFSTGPRTIIAEDGNKSGAEYSNQSSIEPDEVRFIVFGDSQFGNPPEFEQMIHEAELLRPEFVIQVGDLINGYTYDKEQLRKEWRSFKNQISPLSSSYYPVPGNHDVVTDEAEEVYAEVWGKEKLLYSFDEGPVHSIVLNSWWGHEDDRIAEWQRDWLKKDLETFAEKNGGIDSETLQQKSIFVFLHSPLWKYAANTEGRKDWELVHDLLRQYPTRLVVGGHYHEYTWEKRDEIDYVVINSAGVDRTSFREGQFSSFLHVSVLPGGDVRYATIKAGSILPLDSVTPAERQAVSQYRIKEITLPVTGWVEGAPLEMELTVPIENLLDEKRTYKLTWEIPYGTEIEITPLAVWIDVPPRDTINTLFKFETPRAPPTGSMPKLKIQSTRVLRSGVVSREWEEIYRQQKTLDLPDELKSNIALDVPVTFEGTYDLFIAPSVTVKKRAGTIVIDGVFDEDAWSRSESIENLANRDGEEQAIGTRIMFLYDTDYLYIAARMEEPNPDGLTATVVPPIPLTWNDDDLELFFDTGRSQKDYTRLFQNSAGTRFNSLQRWVPDKYFESRYTSELVVKDDAWYLEMQIPWSDIALDYGPDAGDEWGFNVGRHRQQSRDKEMIWSGPLYQPRKYGIMKFE